MARSSRLRNLRTAIWSCAVIAGTAAVLPALAADKQGIAPAKDPAMEPASPPRPAAATGTPDGGVENYNGPKKHRMTSEQLNQLRMLEVRSGAFRDARAAAQSQSLVGPPLSDREKVQHALNRLSFGSKRGEAENILLEGGITDQWQTWAKKQLDPEKVDDKALESALPERFKWYGMSATELYKNYPYKGNGQTWSTLTKELPEYVVVRAAMSNRQFKELMVEFWREHFCVDNSPGEARTRSWTAVEYENDVIRANAFGKFKNMLFASARSSAMLEYLDNKLSHRNAWNENYAREMMELHTLGADRGYGDQDVVELSKVLTGWTYGKDYKFTFNEGDHQPGPKTVLGRQIPAGYQGGEQAIYMLATHKNTAEFISTKLCKYLVNDAPPKALVDRVTATFLKTEGDLPKVYEAIIFSPEFMERANYRAKFKTPFEFVISSLRSSDAKVEDAGNLCFHLNKMGMEIYNCPDPTGYYDRAEAWLDSGVLTSRWDFAFDLLRGGIKGAQPSEKLLADYKAMKPDDMYRMLVKDLIGDDIGDKTRQALKAACDAGDVKQAYALLLGSPSYQQQ